MARIIVTVGIIVLLPVFSHAQGATSIGSADQLARTLKPILIESIPPVLHEKVENWGTQKLVTVGVKFKGLKPQPRKAMREDGEWKKLIVTSQNLPGTLDLKIHEIKTVGDDKLTFKIFLTFQMGVLYDQQNWEHGIRLWSGSVRARAQVKLDLDCESTIRPDFSKGVVPDVILQVRATNAKVGYDKLVVEHIAGIGGTGAKVIGDTAHDMLTLVRPSLERDLLAKVNASVVKAAGTREFRLSFSKLFKAK